MLNYGIKKKDRKSLFLDLEKKLNNSYLYQVF